MEPTVHFYDPNKSCPALCGAPGKKVIQVTKELDFVTCINCWRILVRTKEKAVERFLRK